MEFPFDHSKRSLTEAFYSSGFFGNVGICFRFWIGRGTQRFHSIRWEIFWTSNAISTRVICSYHKTSKGFPVNIFHLVSNVSVRSLFVCKIMVGTFFFVSNNKEKLTANDKYTPVSVNIRRLHYTLDVFKFLLLYECVLHSNDSIHYSPVFLFCFVSVFFFFLSPRRFLLFIGRYDERNNSYKLSLNVCAFTYTRPIRSWKLHKNVPYNRRYCKDRVLLFRSNDR